MDLHQGYSGICHQAISVPHSEPSLRRRESTKEVVPMEPSKKHPNRDEAVKWIGLALKAGALLISLVRLFM